MDAHLKSKWVAALRSGDYEQGQNFFENDGKFCCLGVLCRAAGEPTIVDDAGNWDFTHQAIPDYSIVTKLYCMNDGCSNPLEFKTPSTFPEIADYIEQVL